MTLKRADPYHSEISPSHPDLLNIKYSIHYVLQVPGAHILQE
jgi:hypothetical protein